MKSAFDSVSVEVTDTGSSLSAVEFWSCVSLAAVMHGGLGSIALCVLGGVMGMW